MMGKNAEGISNYTIITQQSDNDDDNGQEEENKTHEQLRLSTTTLS